MILLFLIYARINQLIIYPQVSDQLCLFVLATSVVSNRLLSRSLVFCFSLTHWFFSSCSKKFHISIHQTCDNFLATNKLIYQNDQFRYLNPHLLQLYITHKRHNKRIVFHVWKISNWLLIGYLSIIM